MNKRLVLSSLVASLSLAALSLAALPLVGCSSDAPAPTYSCSVKGPCPNDPVPSAGEVAACESLTQDPTCGSAFATYAACAYAVAFCDARGLSDPTADSKSSACDSDYAAYATCLGNKIDDAGTAQ